MTEEFIVEDDFTIDRRLHVHDERILPFDCISPTKDVTIIGFHGVGTHFLTCPPTIAYAIGPFRGSMA